MSNELELVYAGSRGEGLFIHELLEESKMGSIMKDVFQSSIQAGWVDGLPEDRIKIFVNRENSEKAKALIEKYLASREK